MAVSIQRATSRMLRMQYETIKLHNLPALSSRVASWEASVVRTKCLPCCTFKKLETQQHPRWTEEFKNSSESRKVRAMGALRSLSRRWFLNVKAFRSNPAVGLESCAFRGWWWVESSLVLLLTDNGKISLIGMLRIMQVLRVLTNNSETDGAGLVLRDEPLTGHLGSGRLGDKQ